MMCRMVSRLSDEAGDVEEGQFVRAFAVVAFGGFDGVARVAQTDEVHAFDDAPVFTSRQGMMRFASAIIGCL